MKISELIQSLIDFKNTNGDLECWYASDPEGNDHFPLEYTPTKAHLIEGDGVSYSMTIGQEICVIN